MKKKIFSMNSLISPIKTRKLLAAMLCVSVFATVFVMASPITRGAQAGKETIYVDTSGIDAWAKGPPVQLDDQQLADLKYWIIWDIQWNFDHAVGAGKVEVTNDKAKEAGSNRQVRITNDLGTHIVEDPVTHVRSTGYHYGEWVPKSSAVGVHMKNFVERHGDDYKTDGKWDIQKLRRGIGRTCSHELGHSYGIGHNNYSEMADKMTEDVSSVDRANNEWVFDTYSKNVLINNLGRPPCDSAKDYDKKALIINGYSGPYPIKDVDDWGSVDALFNFSGPLASQFELGWYGVDTDNGIYDGSSKFDFIYETSMLPDPEQNAEMITFFKGNTGTVQFLLRGAPNGTWANQWFILPEDNLHLYDFVQTPSNETVARFVVMDWDIDGIPGIDVQVTLNATAFGNYSSPYNGFTYERISPLDVAVTDVIPSKTIIGQGYSASIDATATNQGNSTETFKVTAYYGSGTFTPDQWNAFEKLGDCDRSGYINNVDADILAANFGMTGPNPCDLNSDGIVNILDAIKLASNIGKQIWAYFLPVIDTQTIVDLVSRDSLTLIFKWNTTGVPYGNYTITAVAGPVANENNTSDNNCTCSIPVHIGVPGDMSGPIPGVYDGIVSMRDISYLIIRFNTKPDLPYWISNADINNDEVVNMRDITIAIMNFNKKELSP